MNDKGRFLLLAAIVAAVLIGGSVLYQRLSKTELPDAPAAAGDAPAAAASPTEDARVAAPDFSVTLADGSAFSFDDALALGKPVVINYWASWCPPCKAEMPDFETVYGEYKDRVTFLMVNSTDGARETVETATAFLLDTGYTFPVYFDTGSELAYAYGLTSLPTTVFIDAEGYFISGTLGAMSETQIKNRIDTLLSK